jgi:translation initiation factor IF-2
VGGDEFTGPPEKVPETKPESSGGPPQPPPRPPKLTARGLLEPDEPSRRIFVPDYIEVGELAGLLGLKPFKVVAELIKLGIFKHADELIEFSLAGTIAQKYGFSAEKVPYP